MKDKYKWLLIGKIIWAAIGAAHYFVASFAELTTDFTEWSPVTRTIFAVFGFGAMLFGLLFWRAEIWTIKDQINEEEE